MASPSPNRGDIMHNPPARRPGTRILAPAGAAALTLALAACGGGGGGTDNLPSAAALNQGGEPPAVAMQNKCRTLADKSLAHGAARVTAATVVAAAGSAPEYCVVQVKFNDSALRFEARLPTSGWNRKLAFL